MIYKAPPSVCLDNPFDKDVTQRARKLASKLNSIVSRMKEGGVIAIEAQWGDGKTWFAQNWLGSLRNEEQRRATLIDAFQHDFVDDPFAMISAQLLTLLEDQNSDGDRLRASIYRVGGLLLKASGKAIGKALMKHTIGEAAGEKLSDEFQDAIAESSGEVADKLIEHQIKAIQSAKGSIEALKQRLTELASKDGPVVIMIDELDRCRPDFAVKTLERIKHFFDVPGLVFVLFINRAAMVSSIDGVYGLGESQSDVYLSKFIHLSMRLPVIRAVNSSSENDIRNFWNKTMERYDDPHPAMTEQVRDLFCLMACAVGMSMRDVERAITLYLLADKNVKPSTKYLAWPIFCKLHSSQMFDAIRNEHLPNSGAADLLSRINAIVGKREPIDLLMHAHQYLEGSLSRTDGMVHIFESQTGDVDAAINKLFAAIDL